MEWSRSSPPVTTSRQAGPSASRSTHRLTRATRWYRHRLETCRIIIIIIVAQSRDGGPQWTYRTVLDGNDLKPFQTNHFDSVGRRGSANLRIAAAPKRRLPACQRITESTQLSAALALWD